MKFIILCCAVVMAADEPRQVPGGVRCWQIVPYVWVHGAKVALRKAREMGYTEEQIAEVRRRCKV